VQLHARDCDGDKNPSAWKDGAVTTTPGFEDPYRQGLPKTGTGGCRPEAFRRRSAMQSFVQARARYGGPWR
jgi:hypothetical protein